MIKQSAGNMYSWVTHTKSYLRGECPHQCSYCYVQAMARRFPALRRRYSGPVKLDEGELAERLGSRRTIFIEHLNDLWAAAVNSTFIWEVLEHCARFPATTYVFQTKNPVRYLQMIRWADFGMPPIPRGSILGTTIETNRAQAAGRAPQPRRRFEAMMDLPAEFRKFVTIEPILDFDLEVLADWLLRLHPDFVNIGADSKGHGLDEPPAEKVRDLLAALSGARIEIRQKTNLARLLG
jgi:protein gp37